MLDVLLDTVLDSVRLLPFLFLTYLFMEALEHHTGSKLSRKIQSAGKWGPVWGGLLGVSAVRVFGSGIEPFCRKSHHGRNSGRYLFVHFG